MSAAGDGKPGDRARATVQVAATPAVAFDLFTREIDAWWRRGSKFRASGRQAGVLCFEGGVGGRLFETFTVDGQEQLVVVGTITAWEPPARFVFDWRNRNFAPHERTEVEVRFEAAGDGTRVTVEHRGWSAIRPDHPARHGLAASAFIASMGMWWGELLGALRRHVAGVNPREM
ncbi:MAG TPA: SRPBCC domain-containing protein [Polyangia bacterium]|nr:SRPBCC domain-containing protein [Polyangia bacterium]